MSNTFMYIWLFGLCTMLSSIAAVWYIEWWAFGLVVSGAILMAFGVWLGKKGPQK